MLRDLESGVALVLLQEVYGGVLEWRCTYFVARGLRRSWRVALHFFVAQRFTEELEMHGVFKCIVLSEF